MSGRASARRTDVAHESNENAGASRARAAFVAAWLALVAAKLVLAGALAPFGDEAFYWQESRAPAWGYSDVPPLTAWLIRLGTALFGHSELALRAPFLLLGSALPWIVVDWARRFGDVRDAWLAGIVALVVPLAALLGVIALPDVPLTLALVAAAPALESAIRRDRARDWLWFGALLALGWLAHYRHAMTYVAGAIFVLATPVGRALLRRRGFWLAQATGLAGLLPTLVFNARNDWAGASFQFVERHAWTFDARALAEPVIQLAVATPLVFAAAVGAIVLGARRAREPAFAVLAGIAGGLLAGWLLLGLVADVERTRLHWPLPAYLVALPLVPRALRAFATTGARRALVTLGAAVSVAATCACFALLAAAAAGVASPRHAWLTDNLRGWDTLGAWARDAVDQRAGEDFVIADNFLLGAELDFAFGGRRIIHVLDHPANRKHGRARQLAIWQRDEAALRARPWRRGLLVVEEASRRPAERPAAYRALCERFGAVRQVDELRLEHGRAPFLVFEVAPGRDATTCELPPFAYLDAPVPDASASRGTLALRGWAFAERRGVARIDVLVDDLAAGALRYGLERPDVLAQWPELEDPNGARLGFAGTLDTRGLAPGPHRIAVRVTTRDGRVRTLAERTIRIE